MKKLKLVYQSTEMNRNNKRSDLYVDTEIKLGPGMIWNITNEGNEPLHINFIMIK
jgi:hypothetical protein